MINHDVTAAKSARRRAISTAIILSGIILTSVLLPSDSAIDVFTVAAVTVGASLVIATCIEATAGIRNLIRVDILILWALYGLTFFEFLFPQPEVDALSPASAANGTYAVLIGFAGLVIGRHLVSRRRSSVNTLSFGSVRSVNVFVLFVLAAVMGYLHIFIAVNFNPVEMLEQMALPRFSQSWARGQYGDAYSLLYELVMLIQIIPPLAGFIYARGSEYKIFQKIIVAIVLAFTFYYGFASGTRSVVAGYVITFASAYFLTKRDMKGRQVLLLGGSALILLLIGMFFMLEFRSGGLSNFSFFADRQYDTVFVDLNIVNISRLIELFPSSYDFLGFEIPFNALIRPIPRFLWSGKPEGLSTGIEDALGVRGMTLSCTFVGEAYMAGGFFAVLVFSLLLGAAAAMWNGVARDVNSGISQLLYASGLVCAAMAMRSILQIVPVLLPTIGLWLYIRYWLPRSPSHRLPGAITRNKP